MNGDLARSSAQALERVRKRGVRRNERRDPDRAVEPGRGIGDVPGWLRTPLSGSGIARAVTGSRARGTLARGSTTGSCEGHPDDGRHPGSRRAARVHARIVSVTSATPSSKSRHIARCAVPRRESGRALGERRRSDRGVRGSVSAGAVGRQRPRPFASASGVTRRAKSRRSGRGCRETLLPPVAPFEPQSSGGLPGAQAPE